MTSDGTIRSRLLLLAMAAAGGTFTAYALARMAPHAALASPWTLWALSPYIAVALLVFTLRGHVSWWFVAANAVALGFGPVAHITMMRHPAPFDPIGAMLLPFYQGIVLFAAWLAALIWQARFARHWPR